jgi:hypothetical protein
MKTNVITAWPSALPDATIAPFSTSTSRSRPGVVKLLPAPTPPDEETIRRLNELAAKNPFCSMHKVKKHETF